MLKTDEITGLFRRFEAITVDYNGIECWTARELQSLLGYSQWRNFFNAIEKAKETCTNAGVVCKRRERRGERCATLKIKNSDILKKIIIILTTFAAALLGQATANDKQMTMTTAKREVAFTLTGIGTALINWGDGTPSDTIILPNNYRWDFPHAHRRIYTGSRVRTIIITGDSITNLKCGYNELTVLDVSRNTALNFLDCYDNKLTVLDVSKNTELRKLHCDNNELIALDVSKNTKLWVLICGRNQLISLDVSKNTALEYLSCEDNQLTVLEIAKNTVLEELHCRDNQLTALDLSENTRLRNLHCGWNELTAAALNALFETLHGRTIDRRYSKWLVVGNNPGTDDCNPNIATIKGWAVDTTHR